MLILVSPHCIICRRIIVNVFSDSQGKITDVVGGKSWNFILHIEWEP